MRFLGDILRALVRLIGLVFMLAGLGALVALAAIFLAGGGMIEQPLGQVWFQHHVSSLNLIQAIVQRRLVPELWDPGIVTVLGWPAWMGLLSVAAVLLVLAALLFGLTRRGRRARPSAAH